MLLPFLLLACADLAPDEDTTAPTAETQATDADTDVPYSPDVLDPLMLDPRYLQVGSFNLHWLHSVPEEGYVPRNDTDYEMMGRLLQALDVEVLGLQEIDGIRALQLLDLPHPWRWEVGDFGGQARVALLYRSDRVSVSNVREPELVTRSSALRNPLVAEITSQATGSRFTVMVLHLKAFDDADSVATRAQQVQDVVDWIRVARTTDDRPVLDELVLVGDLNDTVEGIGDHTTLGPLLQEQALDHVSASCDQGTWIAANSLIDHLFVADALAGRIHDAGGPCQVTDYDRDAPWRNYRGGYGDDQNLSDHRPTWFYLEP